MNFANESSSSEIQIAARNFLCLSLCISPVFCVRVYLSALFDSQLTQSFGGEGLYGEVLFQSFPAQPGFSVSANGKASLNSS